MNLDKVQKELTEAEIEATDLRRQRDATKNNLDQAVPRDLRMQLDKVRKKMAETVRR